MRVWLTRYALTRGIEQIEGTLMGVPSLFHVPHKRTYERPDWHEDFGDAVRRAEEMRIERIMRLKRQINKLEELRFITRGNDDDDDEADSSGC